MAAAKPPVSAPLVPGKPGTDDAIGVDAAAAAFHDLDQFDRLIVAVSGGGDSLALLVLLHRWALGDPVRTAKLVAVTVDHALRPGSGEDAAFVAAVCQTLGLAHRVQVRDQPAPEAFSQAWARDLRYRLLEQVAGEAPRQRTAIITAHHQGDQAETVLMRLARGSGVDGLGAMRRVRVISEPDITYIRPLLSWPKRRLIETLGAAGLGWREDPSNSNTRFERVRVRQALEARATLDLSDAALARLARRAARAADALAVATTEVMADRRVINVSAYGYARLHWPSFCRVPAEIRLRVLVRLIRWCGAEVVSLGRLEDLTEARDWVPPGGLSLAGTAFRAAAGDHILVLAERGRLPVIDLPARVAAQLRFGPFVCAIAPPEEACQLGPLTWPDARAAAASPAGVDPTLAAVPRDTFGRVPLEVLGVQPALVGQRPGISALVAAPTIGCGAARMAVRLAALPGVGAVRGFHEDLS